MTPIDADVQDALALLMGAPTHLDPAAGKLARGSGVYAWWGTAAAVPALPGRRNPADPSVRLLYVGRATSLRGRILRNHLRRSGSSTLRRTLAGLLLPTERFRTVWTDRVVLCADDELRLTAWMRANLRLTWAEHPDPAAIEGELIRRLEPPLNVHGVDPAVVLATVVAAKDRYNASARPPEPPSS